MPAKKNAAAKSPIAKRIILDENGNERVLHGFGWGKAYPLDLDPRIDLTKPIWEQAQSLAAKEIGRASKKAAA